MDFIWLAVQFLKKVVDYAKEIFVKEKLTGIAIKDVNNLELSEPYSIKENIFSFFILQMVKELEH